MRTTLGTLKKQNKNWDFRSLPFKEVAFFADVKRKVAKIYRYTITAPKLMVVITQQAPDVNLTWDIGCILVTTSYNQ